MLLLERLKSNILTKWVIVRPVYTMDILKKLELPIIGVIINYSYSAFVFFFFRATLSQQNTLLWIIINYAQIYIRYIRYALNI